LKASIIKRLEKLEEQFGTCHREPEIDWDSLAQGEKDLLVKASTILRKYGMGLRGEVDLSIATEEELATCDKAAEIYWKRREEAYEKSEDSKTA